MRSPSLLLVVAFLAFSPAARGDLPEIREGDWEITTALEIPGVPVEMPPITEVQCLGPKAPIPYPPGEDLECRPLKVDVEGNEVAWRLGCNGDSVTVSGNAVYYHDVMAGTMEIVFDDPEVGEMSVRYVLKGRYLGQCKRRMKDEG